MIEFFHEVDAEEVRVGATFRLHDRKQREAVQLVLNIMRMLSVGHEPEIVALASQVGFDAVHAEMCAREARARDVTAEATPEGEGRTDSATNEETKR